MEHVHHAPILYSHQIRNCKIGYRRELHKRFTGQHPEMDISEQRIADQRRAIVTKGLISKPWLEKIKVQVAETFKVKNLNREEDTTQLIDENEQKQESRSLESPQTAENPDLATIKAEFYKTLREFEGTDPTIRYQISKQKCSRKLAAIITIINQEILPEYLKNNVTDFLELHTTVYAAAVATVGISGGQNRKKASETLTR
jgi:hypothetical protein